MKPRATNNLLAESPSPRIASYAYRSSDLGGDALPRIRYDKPNAAMMYAWHPKIAGNVVQPGLTTA
jgi:hypothetical protein